MTTPAPAPPPESAKVLALDYGGSRIGVAIAAMDSGLPRPLTTLARINRNEDMRRIREIVREHRIRQVVVGLPLRLDGTRGEMAEEAARFAQRVHKQMGLPVEMVDERLTSWEAERQLEEQQGRVLHESSPHPSNKQRSGKRLAAKASVDAMAAAIILKEYLDRQRTKPAA